MALYSKFLIWCFIQATNRSIERLKDPISWFGPPSHPSSINIAKYIAILKNVCFLFGNCPLYSIIYINIMEFMFGKYIGQVSLLESVMAMVVSLKYLIMLPRVIAKWLLFYSQTWKSSKLSQFLLSEQSNNVSVISNVKPENWITPNEDLYAMNIVNQQILLEKKILSTCLLYELETLAYAYMLKDFFRLVNQLVDMT